EDKPLDGKSIIPALKGEAKELHDALYWSSGGIKGKWAVRSGPWKLVAEKNRMELFDLKNDRSEITDLAAKHPNVVSRLNDQYDAWLDQMGEPLSKQGKRWEGDPVPPATQDSRNERKAKRLESREAR
ncbi:MAG: hypothetical protein ACPHL6_08635, partial [Rubripirellula sp.]